jgi:hypothetical protein
MTLPEAIEDAVKTGSQFRRRKWGGESWPKECCYKSMNVDYCGQLGCRYGMHLSVLDIRADDWFMVARGEPLFDDTRVNTWEPGRAILTEGNC